MVNSKGKIDPRSLRWARQTLLEWIKTQRPLDRILHDVFDEGSVGSSERALTANVAYAFARYGGALVEAPARPENPDWLRAFEGVLQELAVADDAALKKLHDRAKPALEKDARAHFAKVHGASEFLARELAENPEAWHAFLDDMACEAPVGLRLNPTRIDEKEFLARYMAWSPVRSAWLPHSFYLQSRRPITMDSGFRDGLFEIQDENSQLVSWLAAPQPGDRILDLCAGAGGKTLHLAALMQGRGEIHAHDIASKKLVALQARARRAGLTNVRTLDKIPAPDGSYDCVLVDAPCSGIGTLRRSPDRLRSFEAEDAKKLLPLQSELLLRGLGFVRPGGKLIYATCTVRRAENIGLVTKTLEGRTDRYTPGDLRAPLAKVPGLDVDAFLAAARSTSAAALADLPENWRAAALQWGPAPSRTSGALVGDGFFAVIVNC